MQNHSDPNDSTLRQFHLGALDEEERAQLEERALEDEELFERLEIALSDLIDAYVGGELTQGQRDLFEARLSEQGELAQRVAFARGLTEIAREAPDAVPKATPWWKSFLMLSSPAARVALSAAAVTAAVACLWLWRELGSARSDQVDMGQNVARLEAELSDQQTRAAELERALAAERAARAADQERIEESTSEPPAPAPQIDRAPVVAPFVLSVASLVRGVEPATHLVVPKGVDVVELQLDLEEGDGAYPRMRASLRTLGGAEVWARDALAIEATEWGRAVTVAVPAPLLSSTTYELILLGMVDERYEPVAFFEFAVQAG